MKRDAGFTLVEVLVSAMIMGVALVSATWAMSTTSSSKTLLDEGSLTAPLLAREIHELSTSLPKTPSGTVGATSGAAVVALDCLIGAAFSPPILADRTADTSLGGWSQSVGLTVYDLADLFTPSSADPADGLPEDAPSLYKLSVTIAKDGNDIDTFHWWLPP